MADLYRKQINVVVINLVTIENTCKHNISLLRGVVPFSSLVELTCLQKITDYIKTVCIE